MKKKISKLKRSFYFNWIKFLNYFHSYNYENALNQVFAGNKHSSTIYILLQIRPDLFENNSKYGKLTFDYIMENKDLNLLKAILKTNIKNSPINQELSFERFKFHNAKVNYLTLAHLKNFTDAEAIIANHISDSNYYFSFIYSLLKNDKDWFNFFDLNRCFNYAVNEFGPKPNVNTSNITEQTKWILDKPFKLELTPITAAILGKSDSEILKKLWNESPDVLKKVYYIFSEGYGHDNDPVFGGYPDYWAKIMGYEKDFIDLVT